VREMWELPEPSLGTKAVRAATVIALVWAVAAVPLVLWLTLRTPPAAPPPPQRELSTMERAAVHLAGQELSTSPVTLTSTVTSAAARLEVEETVDIARGVSVGQVRSGSQTAEMMTLGDKVMLRGNAAFWSTVGVPTSEPGWIEVGDRLGAIPFPLRAAIAALEPGDEARVDTAPGDGATMIFRNGTLTAGFTGATVVSLTADERTAAVTPPVSQLRSRLAAVAGDAPAAAGTLTGTSGALTVAAVPAPPPAEDTPEP